MVSGDQILGIVIHDCKLWSITCCLQEALKVSSTSVKMFTVIDVSFWRAICVVWHVSPSNARPCCEVVEFVQIEVFWGQVMDAFR